LVNLTASNGSDARKIVPGYAPSEIAFFPQDSQTTWTMFTRRLEEPLPVRVFQVISGSIALHPPTILQIMRKEKAIEKT